MTAKRTAAKKPAPVKKAAAKRTPAPRDSLPVAPAADADVVLGTPADRAEQRVDLGDQDAAGERAGRRSSPPRCAAGFVIWDGATGLCRGCIIAKRDACAGV